MRTVPASTLDLFCDSVRSMGDATICAVIEFSDRVDERQLRSAVSACLDAIPVMRSRLVRDDHPHWDLLDRIEGDDAVPVIVVTDGDYHPHVAHAMDPGCPPQFRVRVLRTLVHDVAVINMAHAAADACGLKALVAMLMSEYDRPGSASDVSGLQPRDVSWTVDKAHGPLPAMRQVDPMWPRTWGVSDAPSTFHRVVLSKDDVTSLKMRVKAEGGTVNDAILAAYALAMVGLTGFTGTKDIFFPVDLRRHLAPGDRIFSNQSANLCFPMGLRQGMGMSEAFATVATITRSMKVDGLGLLEQAAMERACDPAGDALAKMVSGVEELQRNGLADVFVSNPGLMELPGIKGIEDAYICYPGTYMPSFCLVASTFCGRMTVTVGYQDDDRSRSVTAEALDRFIGHLRMWA